MQLTPYRSGSGNLGGVSPKPVAACELVRQHGGVRSPSCLQTLSASPGQGRHRGPISHLGLGSSQLQLLNLLCPGGGA